jgi:hypothetical protein
MKHFKIALLLLSLSPKVLIANDCVVNQGGSLVTIPANEARSLYDEGQSLHNHPVQDQDGLGTCYANTTSTVLKSLLPDHPDISYTHAAIEATSGRTSKFEALNRRDGNETALFDGGNVCSTIDALQRRGGACPQRFSLTETPAGARNPDIQSDLMRGLGRYLDRRASPSDQNDFRLVVEALREQLTQQDRTCREMIAAPLPLSEAIGDILGRAGVRASSSDTHCGRAMRAAITRAMTAASLLGRDRYRVIPNPDVIARVEQLISTDPDLRRAMEEYASSTATDPTQDHNTHRRLAPIWNRLLFSIISREQLAAACPTPPNISPLRSSGITEANFIRNIRKSKQQICNNLASGEAPLKAPLLRAIVQHDPRLNCLSPSRQNELFDVIMPLLEVGHNLEDLASVNARLREGASEGAANMQAILMPQCLGRENRISLDGITCRGDIFCRMDGESDDWLNPYTGGSRDCLTPAASRSLLRSRIIAGIREGRALGIGVCAAFLDNPHVATNHCRSGRNRRNGSSRPQIDEHAMSVVGYKCEAGRIKYEILNSWGRTCPIASGAMRSAGMECEVQNGRPTGRLWVTESLLAENATEVTDVIRRP